MKIVHILLLFLIALIWGLNFVVIKVGLDNFPPLLFSALRFFAAALPLCFFVRKPAISWSLLAGIGAMLCVVKFSLLFIAMKSGLSSGMASLLLQSQAIFTILLAGIFGERPSLWQIAGAAISLSGLAMIARSTGGELPATAMLLALGAAASWAIANLLMRKVPAAEMLAVIVWASATAPVPLLLLSFALEGWNRNVAALLSISFTGLAAIVYIAYAATIFGFAVWGSLIRRYGAGRVAPFSLLVPLAGMSASALLLGEEFGSQRIVAAALIVCGVAVGLRRQSFSLRRKFEKDSMRETPGHPPRGR